MSTVGTRPVARPVWAIVLLLGCGSSSPGGGADARDGGAPPAMDGGPGDRRAESAQPSPDAERDGRDDGGGADQGGASGGDGPPGDSGGSGGASRADDGPTEAGDGPPRAPDGPPGGPDPLAGTYGTRARLLEPNSEMAVAALDGEVYVLGGYPASRQSQRTLQIYNPGTNRWRRAQDAPVPLHHPVIAGVGGKLYSLGGQPDTDLT